MVRTRLTPKVPRGVPLPATEGGNPWDDLIINEVCGPMEFDIKPSTHQKHCDMLDIHHPYFEQELHLFPWNYLSGYRVVPQWKGRRNNQAIAHDTQYNYFKPAKVGDRLFGLLILSEKGEIRGRKYYQRQDMIFDENHELVSQIYYRSITMNDQTELPNRGARTKERQFENWWQGEAPGPMPANTPDLPVGTELPNHLTPPCPMRVSGFEKGGWDEKVWVKNIHSDEYARSLGYAGGVVEAPIVTELGTLLPVVEFFGAEQYFNTGKLDTKICGPVYVGDKLVGKLRIRDRWPERECFRTVLDFRIEKEDGGLCQIGTVSALNQLPAIES